MTEQRRIHIPQPRLQIDFSLALSTLRNTCMQEALGATVRELEVAEIDRHLQAFVPGPRLSALASHGLRGELLFAVPAILERNPRLLGYYRLLLGFSQKEFYSAKLGLSAFKNLEQSGMLTAVNKARLPALCRELIRCAGELLDGIGPETISRELLDDLTLLTLGPQLRGGANVRKGMAAIVTVFQAMKDIVGPSIVAASPSRMEVRNAAGRTVLIEFAPDPDIIIREEIATDKYRNIISVEIKGGTDFSNIHNRVGEAEKSHQKARQSGYVECWTVVNVDRIDLALAKRESPSTNRFYRLSELASGKGEEFMDFRGRIVALTGIPG